MEPVFESQTKTKLGSADIAPDGESLRTFIGNFLKTNLDNYLHKHPQVAEAIQKRILSAERERKDLKGIQKLARERAKQAKVHNKKLRDCRVHFDSKHKRREESTLFITEGDSASGSITKSRDVETQAVFSLRGKPLNTYGCRARSSTKTRSSPCSRPRSTSRTASRTCATTGSSSPPMPTWTACTSACCCSRSSSSSSRK